MHFHLLVEYGFICTFLKKRVGNRIHNYAKEATLMSTLVKTYGVWKWRNKFPNENHRKQISLRTSSKRLALQKQTQLDQLFEEGYSFDDLQSYIEIGRLPKDDIITWGALFTAYREWMHKADLSDSWKEITHYDLVPLLDFLGTENHVKEFDRHRTPEDYLIWRSKAKKTMKDELATLKRVLKWGYNASMISNLIAFDLPKQVRGKVTKKGQFFRDDELKALFGSDLPYYVQVFYKVMLQMGFRVSTTGNIYIDHIDLKRGTIFVPAKKGVTKTKSDLFYEIPNSLKMLLRDYLETIKGCVRLFPEFSPSFRRVEAARLKRILTALDFPEDRVRELSLHSFRHTFAKRFLEAGGTLSELAEAMGHTDSYITETYRHFETKTIRRAIDRMDDYHDNL